MPVNTNRVNSIGMLKKEIATFEKLNIPARYIELWKINFSLVNVSKEIINNCANTNVDIQNTLGGTKLSGSSKITDEFPTQDMKQAHVLVKLISTGEFYYHYFFVPIHFNSHY